jgi:hypothetical protein
MPLDKNVIDPSQPAPTLTFCEWDVDHRRAILVSLPFFPLLLSISLLATYVSICGFLGGFNALGLMYDPYMIIQNRRREVLAS